jgi:hypothetical protein
VVDGGKECEIDTKGAGHQGGERVQNKICFTHVSHIKYQEQWYQQLQETRVRCALVDGFRGRHINVFRLAQAETNKNNKKTGRTWEVVVEAVGHINSSSFQNIDHKFPLP